ncbi:MAG TPA: 30S ribosomal protein S4e, partial [Candidatus Aenigmarchaeota archaeon]|nr:30S ribosomal protein S4e [Candidatus Aenigmarchaeota archaeon]
MYLKRYLIPKYWRVAKKAYKWAVRPSPGPHPIDRCIPLLVLVRDVLGIAENAKEAKKIIKKGELMIDGVIRKDHRFPVGLMDVVAIPKMKMYYRVVLD